MTAEFAPRLEFDPDEDGLGKLPGPVDERLDAIHTPQGRNLQRGLFASVGLKAYAERVGGDDSLFTQAADFIGDLMHLCDATGLDFDSLVYSGSSHYRAETGGEG